MKAPVLGPGLFSQIGKLEKRKMKLKKILKRVLLGLVALVILILAVLHIGVTVKYWDYFKNADSVFMIPGLFDNIVPQGFDYIPETDTYLMCGYMSDGTSSRIYVRFPDGTTRYTSLYHADGSVYDKHAGGICHNGDFVYLAGDDGVDVFSFDQVILGGEAQMLGTIPTGHDMAFCSFHDGLLYAGNFYYPEHYETPDHHRITTPAGDQNTSLITVFRADDSFEFGIDPQAVAAISAPDKVQGMTFTEDGIVLSISWSLTDSNLLFYEEDQRVGSVEVPTGEVPLYYLDSENLLHTAVLPPMSEELVYRDGRVEVMCESACNKYMFGKLIRGWQVFAYSPDSQ